MTATDLPQTDDADAGTGEQPDVDARDRRSRRNVVVATAAVLAVVAGAVVLTLPATGGGT